MGLISASDDAPPEPLPASGDSHQPSNTRDPRSTEKLRVPYAQNVKRIDARRHPRVGDHDMNLADAGSREGIDGPTGATASTDVE